MKKKLNAALSLALITLLSLTLNYGAFADQPPDNVQGNWTIYSTSIKNGETVVKHVQIAQYGNSLTGYFEGPDQSGPIQGEVNGHNIRFNTVTRTVLHFRGQVFGDTMSGEYGIRGKHAQWQATRPATAPAAAPPTRERFTDSAGLSASGDDGRLSISGSRARAGIYAARSRRRITARKAAQLVMPSRAAPSHLQGNSASAPAPLSADQLDTLVPPIALYPDALVAQVLAAATNPDQLTYADDWLAQNRNLTGSALAQAVDQQSWDPSIKALTQFPSRDGQPCA